MFVSRAASLVGEVGAPWRVVLVGQQNQELLMLGDGRAALLLGRRVHVSRDLLPEKKRELIDAACLLVSYMPLALSSCRAQKDHSATAAASAHC